ncbi:MAG TPA: circadian clock KaiB family protein [Anaeromyxobacteraceae bacterium]|nr:circadian clock KaiB family protein [Anaeromyxobacteraceae bacterium]
MSGEERGVKGLAAPPASGEPAGEACLAWQLRLYVAGQTARSARALVNLRRICDEHLAGRYRLDVVDVLRDPQAARTDQIVALPTVVRTLPMPVRKIIGDLSNDERVLVGLDLRPLGSTGT